MVVVRPSASRTEQVIELGNISDHLERLRKSLHAMHREVTDAKERKQLQDMRAHKGAPANFDIGDFVTEALPHPFRIENLVTGRTYEVHASRLKFYADADLNTNEELLELVSNQGMVLGVEGFSGHRLNQQLKRWELLVAWTGLQAIENSWEPIITLLQDVPVRVRDYVSSSGDADLQAPLG
ncbi:hypothetical protein F442_10604 [Phytophthora nicotianae P10297]|uniref:Chromo domain-containing protein n=1 Tax=Phytophthora nicotianae P10297 TaxID=1317064 RepID=W2Z532_PHYNI|nr:hypothetical protein F442_10604 [Phytophthora nicotianae P10297]